MVKRLEFYNPQGSPVTTSNYTLKTINTSKGKRKQAIATVKGKKLYRFVSMDFKK